ncbi:MAG: electron transport complex subunit RsxC [bacterium]
MQPYPEYFRLLPQEVRDIVKEAGIVGLGGAAFPTQVKLTPPKDKVIDLVIINGCECGPYLTNDYRLMLEFPRDIIDGLKIIMRTVNAPKGLIAIESNKPLAIEKMRQEVNKNPNIKVVVLKTKYPQGAEKQLANAITGQEIPPGGLPWDVRCAIYNISTALAIREAVVKGYPLIERVITVTGNGIKTPGNVKVRIGTLVSEVVEQCGGYRGEVAKIILGGPMMGLSQSTDQVPVIKGTSGILVLTKDEVDIREEGPCIKCARCIDVCPVRLAPTTIALYARHRIWDRTEQYNVSDCMECGSCAYICPAKIPLVKYMKDAKSQVVLRQKRKAALKKGKNK